VIDYLSLEDLLAIVDRAGLPAIRDLGLLDSSAHRPRTSLIGEDAYPTLDEKAAVLLESIVRNHPLLDGNKRLGWLAVTLFLRLNGRTFHVPHDAGYDLVIAVATGEMPYAESAAWIAQWP
jgi:death-on-curing protein